MTNQYWQHKTSGEVYAVQFENGEVFSACGPLHHSEVTSENLKDWNFNNEIELAEDLHNHQEDYRLYENH